MALTTGARVAKGSRVRDRRPPWQLQLGEEVARDPVDPGGCGRVGSIGHRIERRGYRSARPLSDGVRGTGLAEPTSSQSLTRKLKTFVNRQEAVGEAWPATTRGAGKTTYVNALGTARAVTRPTTRGFSARAGQVSLYRPPTIGRCRAGQRCGQSLGSPISPGSALWSG